MGKQVTVQLDERQIERLEQYMDREQIDNQSEALRTAIDEGIVKLGYGTRMRNQIRLIRNLSQESGRILAWMGIGWLALTWLFPVGARMPAAGLFIGAFAMIAIDRFLERFGHRISRFLENRTA